jgi:hypothetical protein
MQRTFALLVVVSLGAFGCGSNGGGKSDGAAGAGGGAGATAGAGDTSDAAPASDGAAGAHADAADAPVDMTSDAPVDMTSDAPVDMTSDAPVDMTVDAPVDMTSDAPVDMTVDAPSEVRSEGGADVVAEVGGDGGTAFQSFCSAVRGVLVARAQTCIGYGPVAAQKIVNTDPCAAWGPAITAGTMSFDATNAAACVTALGALACAADGRPAICDDVLTGLVAQGSSPTGSCDMARQLLFFSECSPGTACMRGVTGSPCKGSCIHINAVGDPCTGNDTRITPSGTWTSGFCGPGLTCDGTSHCKAKSVLGGVCVSTDSCAPGLYCNSGTCQAQSTTGACSTGLECLAPARCPPPSTAAQTCKLPPVAGASCASIDDCMPGFFYCGVDSKCHEDGTLGDACACELGMTPCSTAGGARCAVGFCDATTTHTCVRSTTSCIGDADCGTSALCYTPSTASGLTCTPVCI